MPAMTLVIDRDSSYLQRNMAFGRHREHRCIAISIDTPNRALDCKFAFGSAAEALDLEEIRERQALAYAPGVGSSSSDTYPGYGSLVIRGEMSLGSLFVFVGLLQQFSGQVSSMAGIINTLQQSLIGARRVFEVLDAPLGVENPKNPVQLDQIRGHFSR